VKKGRDNERARRPIGKVTLRLKNEGEKKEATDGENVGKKGLKNEGSWKFTIRKLSKKAIAGLKEKPEREVPDSGPPAKGGRPHILLLYQGGTLTRGGLAGCRKTRRRALDQNG